MRSRLAAMGSVRARVTVAAVLAVAIAFPLMRWGLLSQVRSALEDEVQVTVKQEVQRTASLIEPTTLYLRGGLLSDRQPEVAVEVVDSRGTVLARSPELASAEAITSVQPRVGEVRYLTLRSAISGDRGRELGVAISTTEQGQVVHVYGVAFLGQVERSVNLFGSTLWWLYPFTLLLVGLAAWLLAGRALAPVARVRAEVEEISASDLHRRVEEPHTADEIAGLVHTMNAMLERIDASISRQRQFVSDASHELRSPIAAILAQSQVARAHPGSVEVAEMAARIEREGIRLGDLVDDLLLLARSDEGGLELRRVDVDLDDLLTEEADRLRAQGDLRVDTSEVQAVRVRGDRELLGRCVRNLVDNATRHAKGTVSLSCATRGDGVELVVADDGDGVDPAIAETIFERFVRADESRARETGGSGLGLAISREVATQHGGGLVLDTSYARGARFVLSLPAGS